MASTILKYLFAIFGQARIKIKVIQPCVDPLARPHRTLPQRLFNRGTGIFPKTSQQFDRSYG